MYVHDLALTLLALGHMPVVFSTRGGPVGDIMRGRTIPVVERLGQIARAPELIHGNSPVETVAALLAFPGVPAVFTCHGWDSPDAAPPRFDRIVFYIAVDETCRDRLICREGIPQSKVVVEFNSVDLARFIRRPALPVRPRRALVFSNNAADSNYLPAIREACSMEELTLQVAGHASGATQTAPEQMLIEQDIVFAKARCALESLAAGNAVILCDTAGLGPMVTTENVGRLRGMNFGCRALQERHDPARIRKEIQAYSADDAGRVCDGIREAEGILPATERMIAVYRDAIRLHKESGSNALDQEMRSTSTFLESIAPISNTHYIHRCEVAATQTIREESAAIRAFVQSIPMLPLDRDEQDRIRVIEGFVSPIFTSIKELTGIVEIHNRTSKLLSSQPPNPVHISYHWISPGGHTIVAEGLRNKLLPPLAPDERRKYLVKVAPPDAPGEWILRITLVQECIAWFDENGLQCFVDLPLTLV